MIDTGSQKSQRLRKEEVQEIETGMLLTTITDHGYGIEQKEFKNLFTMFNSASESYFKTKGIGLGLSTAKVLTQALQGGIHLNSKHGKGTEVGFSIAV